MERTSALFKEITPQPLNAGVVDRLSCDVTPSTSSSSFQHKQRHIGIFIAHVWSGQNVQQNYIIIVISIIFKHVENTKGVQEVGYVIEMEYTQSGWWTETKLVQQNWITAV